MQESTHGVPNSSSQTAVIPVVGCSSPFVRLTEHLSTLRAWCTQCLSGENPTCSVPAYGRNTKSKVLRTTSMHYAMITPALQYTWCPSDVSHPLKFPRPPPLAPPSPGNCNCRWRICLAPWKAAVKANTAKTDTPAHLKHRQ